MRTIWIVNESGHDYGKALGIYPDAKLHPLTIGSVNPLNVDRLLDQIVRGAVKFSSPDDVVLLSGTPVLNALSVSVWLMFRGECTFLLWDAKKRRYKPYTVTADQISHLIDRHQK